MNVFKMKRTYTIIFIGLLVFSTLAFAASAVKIFDRSGVPQGLDMIDGRLIISGGGGSDAKVIWMAADTDGTSQEVILPIGDECNEFLIQVHSGSDTDYDLASSAVGFLYSHSEGGDFIIVPNSGLILSVSKDVSAATATLGWVKAPSGNKISVLLLY